MKLKNILIVVKDIEKSKQFYRDMFGLQVALDNDGNVILTEGLVLQEENIWREFVGVDVITKNNSSELYFEEKDIEFIAQVSDALDHAVRLQLFRHIMQKNRAMEQVCNKDLVAHFDYAQATISQHMKKLVQSGLIEIQKKDKFSYYYANLGILMQYINATKKYSVI